MNLFTGLRNSSFVSSWVVSRVRLPQHVLFQSPQNIFSSEKNLSNFSFLDLSVDTHDIRTLNFLHYVISVASSDCIISFGKAVHRCENQWTSRYAIANCKFKSCLEKFRHLVLISLSRSYENRDFSFSHQEYYRKLKLKNACQKAAARMFSRKWEGRICLMPEKDERDI